MFFAPRRHRAVGSVVDILNIGGCIIRGESGIGKSESVLGLIERGFRPGVRTTSPASC